MALQGIPTGSPIPRRARQFKPAAGRGLSTGSLRPVVLVANKLASGTEAVETLGAPIQSLADCYTRFGQRSEMAWKYRAYVAVDPFALIYGVAVAEGGGAAASTVSYTFATTASVSTVVNVDSCKGRLQFQVTAGDAPATQVINAVAAINADPDLPFSAAINGSSAAVLDITTYQKGPRSKYWILQLRITSDDPTQATTITKGSVTAGTTADSVANAIVAIDQSEFTYHSLACTAVSSVTSSDGGVGQYAAYIASSVAPVGNKSQMMIIGVDGTSAQATAVMQSAVVNSVFSHCYRVKNNDWHPAMIAAHHTAIHHVTEVNYAAANLTNWAENSTLGQVYRVPDPFNKADRPTPTQETTDLQGGVSTVGFHADGSAYIVRSITGYSWTGSSSTSDFRAREGHYPSVLFKFWEDLEAQLITQNQPNVAADPPAAGKPVAGFMYPRGVKSIANTLIAAMTRAYQDGKALLDPSVLKDMLRATNVDLSAAGWELDVAIAAVRHNLFDDTVISDVSPAY
jgi:phage tail sheath gpL-like